MQVKNELLEVETNLELDEPEKKTRSLQSITFDLENIDKLLENPDFNPEELVGEIKDKIDNIDYFIKWCSDRAKQYKETADTYYKTQKSIENSIKRLKEYCVNDMVMKEFTTISGHMRRMDLKTKKTFTITAEPSAKMYLLHPELCLSETVYHWNKDLIKSKFKKNELPEGIAGNKIGEPYIQFFNNSNLKKSKSVKKKTTKTIDKENENEKLISEPITTT